MGLPGHPTPDNLYYAGPLQARLRELLAARPAGAPRAVLVSPDLGAEKRLKAYAQALALPLIVCNKTRNYAVANTVECTEVFVPRSLDVAGALGIVVDDMVDTAGTLMATLVALRAHGLEAVWIVVTHAVLSGPAVQRLAESAMVHKVVCSDTLPLPAGALAALGGKLEVVPCAPMLRSALLQLATGGSLSMLFK